MEFIHVDISGFPGAIPDHIPVYAIMSFLENAELADIYNYIEMEIMENIREGHLGEDDEYYWRSFIKLRERFMAEFNRTTFLLEITKLNITARFSLYDIILHYAGTKNVMYSVSPRES